MTGPDDINGSSPARVARARQHGDVPVSGLMSQCAGIVALVTCLGWLGHAACAAFEASLKRALHTPATVDPLAYSHDLATSVLSLAVPIASLAAVTAFALTALQTRGLFWFTAESHAVTPRTPFMSRRATGLVAAARFCAAALAVGAVVAHDVLRSVARLSSEPGNLQSLGPAGLANVRTMCVHVLIATAVLAAIDLAATRWLWVRRITPSESERRAELRETTTAPEVRRAIQHLSRQKD